MRFYKPSPEYLNYIYSLDNNIINTKNMIGVVIRLNEMIYFLPIDSVSRTDYDENNKLRKTTPTILRMFDTKTQDYIGKCLFSNMFPIPYKDLIPLEISTLKKDEISLAEKKLEYLRLQMDRVLKAAERLYKQKTRNYAQAYLNATIDFKKIEIAANRWELDHYKKHYNRFPDSHYFLTNPNMKGITEYDLMNKNTKVARIKFDNEKQSVLSIIEIYNPEYAPLECFENKIMTSVAITEWFRGRGIPSWRDGLDDFLDNIGIKNKDTLLNKAFGLSLSDQYWMNPINISMNWEDINFFEHNFNSSDYQDAVFENKVVDLKKVDLYSPNNTSDGMLKKTWIVGSDEKRYMLKGSFKEKGMEPFNEVLASMICKVLNLEHVAYSLEILNGKVLSKCECFIDKDTELLSAYSILKYNEIDMLSENKNVYESYVNILKSMGLENVEENIAKMFILDYIIVNVDRHLGNFGVIRNVDTLKWEKIAPNFDSGQALLSQKKVYEMDFNNVTGSFFNEKEVDFEIILQKVMNNINFKIDINGLNTVSDEWRELLMSYQHVSHISTERIDITVNGLKKRIQKLSQRFNF
ncbi:MAG: type III toxin-antitoxin system ToxN/AbiQ family toxin [Coprobacillus cateniformis]|uniref:type III toxin-antitoxin system ToxN/AbiQ family toxin n=1 Tax=Longibaculum muris TaxID=1796628 RepID=UPI003AB23DFA|nr:type III toxin-antitoxin system ToxN/AbiQ family toxin [Coprobacillus cateniformis]